MSPDLAVVSQAASPTALKDRAALVGALLREYGHLSRRRMRREMKSLGLTVTEARTLVYVVFNPGIVQRRLAEIMDLQPIVLTRIIDSFEAKGFAERRTSDEDRRVRRIYLTNRGRNLARRVRAFSESLDREITIRLSAEALQSLGTALRDANQSLRNGG